MAGPCLVCGFETGMDVCPRCNTILRADGAVCDACGRPYEGRTATCADCGAAKVSEGTADSEALEALAAIPGIAAERARELAAHGFRDFSDIVRLSLPEGATRRGLHHTIARQALLANLEVPREPDVGGARCAMCGAAWPVGEVRCAACGSAFDVVSNPENVEQKLRDVTGNVVDLAKDADFQAMPPEIRDEFLRAGSLDQGDLLRDDARHQIEAWRLKGFDVAPVERLLDDDVDRFRERGTRLIRVQAMKITESGTYRCPLCELRLESTAEECGNCGARFV